MYLGVSGSFLCCVLYVVLAGSSLCLLLGSVLVVVMVCMIEKLTTVSSHDWLLVWSI